MGIACTSPPPATIPSCSTKCWPTYRPCPAKPWWIAPSAGLGTPWPSGNGSAARLLIGLDADPRNLEFAAGRLKGLACRVRLFHANFAKLSTVLYEVGNPPVNGILADLGVSTNQLFDPAYGLSFDRSMPLDMRLDPELPENAADLIDKLPEESLANVLYQLAQERYSRQIARKIVETRRQSPIRETEALAELVRSAIPRRGKPRSGWIRPRARSWRCGWRSTGRWKISASC